MNIMRDVRGGVLFLGVRRSFSTLSRRGQAAQFVDRRCQIREFREQPPMWRALQGAPLGINHREYLWRSKNGEPPLPFAGTI